MGEYERLPHNFYQALMQVSGSISSELLVSGAGIELSRETEGFQLDPNCVSDIPLEDEILRDFKNLPTGI